MSLLQNSTVIQALKTKTMKKVILYVLLAIYMMISIAMWVS